MRQFTYRIAVPAVLFAGGVAAAQVVLQGNVQIQIAAQPVPANGPATKEGKEKKAPSVEVMTFPQDRDAKNMIQAVKDYVKEYSEKPDKAPWDRICQAAQQVLDAKSDSFFELPKASADAPLGRVSAKAEINRLIGQFPPAGRQFYQLAYGPTAENLLAQAKAANYDRAILADISQRYFHTKAGAQATLLLAAVQLERGNYVEAAYSYERLLSRPDSDEIWTPLTTFKALAAMKRAGSPLEAPVMKQLAEKLEKKFPRDGLSIGRKSYSLDELKSELERKSDYLSAVSEAYVAMRYVNPSHTALQEGGKPFLDPAWSQSLYFHAGGGGIGLEEGNTWVRQNLEDVLKTINPAKLEPAIPGFFPATAQNLVFFRSYDGVFAYITKDGFNNNGKPSRAGDLYWFSHSKGGAASLYANGSSTRTTAYNDGLKKEDIENNWRYFRDQAQLKTILFENPLVGSLTHDGKAVYIIDDAALPPPPPNLNNEFGGFQPVTAGAQPGNGGHSKSLIDGSRLKALDINNGTTLWTLGEPVTEQPLKEEEEEKTTNTLLLLQNSYFLGPPLPLNGKLYVLYERNGVIRLACLDPGKLLTFSVTGPFRPEYPIRFWNRDWDVVTQITRTYTYPELVWNQRLGEPNMRLPADTFRRFQCSYLAFADGVMICPTNAGAVVAVDIMSRSLLWARSYRTLSTNNGATDENGMRIRRGIMMNANGTVATGGQSPLNKDRWRAAAPIISQGRVVFAAFDAEALYCLDLRTGEVLWKEKQKDGDLYVGGLMGDNVLIVNKKTIRAIKLVGKPKTPNADGKEEVVAAWSIPIGLPAGHGVASKDGIYYLPVAQSAEDPQPQVWAIDVAKGEVVAKAAYRKKDLSEGKPLLGNLAFHEGQLYSQSPTELAVFPLIELKKQEMNRLLSANPKDPTGLVARGEMLLDEGKLADAIADFTVAAKNDPPEPALMRLHDKLFLAYTELLRKDFAAGEQYLPEYKTLCSCPVNAEDPNLRERQMEERTRRQRLYLELLAKGREKQGRLTEAFDYYREFAGYGGNKELVSLSDEPYGKTRPDVWARGRIEAMIRNAKDDAARKPILALVDREWLSVKDGKDLGKLREFVAIFGQHFAVGREAELILGEKLLASEKEEDHREAQAVLTRLAATSEEPVLAARAIEGLAKLASRKGQVEAAVSFYLTLGSQYAATKIHGNQTGADIFNELLTDKRLLPYLEPARLPTPSRIKAVKENTPNNNYVPPGYVLDPDGAEHEPFYRRHRIMLSNNDGGAGWVLHVYDRGSGEEKWKVPGLQMYNPTGALNYRVAQARGNLLLLHMGVSIHCFDLAEKKRLWEYPVFGEGKGIDFNNVRADANSDEELTITYNADGSKLTIGRSSILETNYAALVTRDGLVAIDPTSGSKLWTRTNVSPSAMIFGDARNVFVVETAGGKTTSKVLRAVDGTPIDGVPDFASLVTGTGRVRIVGRNILLTEGGRLKPLAIRLYDPLTGKDVWRKEYASMPEPEDYKKKGLEFNGQAKLLKTFSPELTGAFERDGKFEVLNVLTGQIVFKAKIEGPNAELHASMTGQPVLLGDAERFYLVLNKTSDASNRNNYMYSSLRILMMSGPMYCFEKATGVQPWYWDKLFEGQQLIVERFAEMPALVAATHTAEEEEGAQPAVGRRVNGGNQVYRVVILDKVSGRIRMLSNMNANGNFYAITTDPRSASARLLRGDLNVVISPDDSAPGSEAASASGSSGNAPPVTPLAPAK